jgi:outer membrane protein assembly factor BamE (lipoprotein component of BamABCDE complex)
MKRNLLIFLFIGTMLVMDCAVGVNFVRPSDEKVALGLTTKSQIVAMMGEPNFKGEEYTNGERMEWISFAFVDMNGEPVFKGVTPSRAIAFFFHNDTLVGKEFVSSFKSDNTYFSPKKAKSVKQGMNRTDVENLLGKPNGEYWYPMTSDKARKGISYLFSRTKNIKSNRNILVLEIDTNNVVQKSNFTQFKQSE